MKQTYTFYDGGTIEFEDSRSVKELIAYAFSTFGYYEPLGLDTVTIFQSYHPETSTGWFTTDVELPCAVEIKSPDDLFFAYHMPDVFYFAEGGWGHHMSGLGNRPDIPNEVSLKIRFEDFEDTVVINGKYRFRDIIAKLKEVEYVPADAEAICVKLIGCTGCNYRISFSDPLLDLCLTEFLVEIQRRSEEIEKNRGVSVSYEIFEIL